MRYFLSIIALLGVGLTGARAQVAVADTTHQAAMTVGRAVCVLSPTDGHNARGLVTFELLEMGVQIVADVQGLPPGLHGIHIHEYGDCTARDATSAGGHFNPGRKPHGAPTDRERHLGDLGNLSANADSVARLEWLDPQLSLTGPEGIIGLAVVIHEKEDDLKSQPAGDAGGRVACGVIGSAKK